MNRWEPNYHINTQILIYVTVYWLKYLDQLKYEIDAYYSL